MRIISDLHWRLDTPTYRRDKSYEQTLINKMNALFEGEDVVVVCGDIFHRPDDFEAAFSLARYLLDKRKILYAIRGQHDMPYHARNAKSSAYGMLELLGLIRKPSELETDLCVFYDMEWGAKMPTITQGRLQSNHIIVAHVSLTGGGLKLENSPTAEAFSNSARIQGFTHVFTGDNHKRFQEGIVYNAGCFHRMSRDLVDQLPAYWELGYDGHVKLTELSCSPVDITVTVGKVEEQKMVAGAGFAEALTATSDVTVDTFLENLRAKLNKMTGLAKDLLSECITICESTK